MTPTAPRGIVMDDRQRLHWLRLSRVNGIGPATFRDLINHCGTAERALEALPELSRRASGRRRIVIPPEASIAREAEHLARFGGRIVCSGEPDYPPALRAVDAAPMVLLVKGEGRALRRSAVGIVGSRAASLASVKLTRGFAQAFAAAGLTVVSGMARGIDGAAHEGSLEAGTVAVVAGGIDVVYPPEHAKLAEAIVAGGGAIVSEMPFGWKPRAKDFPRRNRIIAGMSLGLLVVEAALRSGSLITARMANEMGREVFAVPGSPLDPRSAGANGLIHEGATFTTEPANVLDALRPLLGGAAPTPAPAVLEEAPAAAPLRLPEGGEREAVLAALDRTPVSVDELVRFTGLSPGAVQLVLLELDLGGAVVRHPGNRVSSL